MNISYRIIAEMERSKADRISTQLKSIESDQKSVAIKIDGPTYTDAQKKFSAKSIQRATALYDQQQDLKKLFKSLQMPFAIKSSRARFSIIWLIYVFLSPSGMSSFFIRGWRINIIRNMVVNTKGKGLAPKISDLNDVGKCIKEGVKLIGARATYNLPRVLIMIIIGYDFYELIIDWVLFFFSGLVGDPNNSVEEMLNQSALYLSISHGGELAFMALYSLFVTPAYKIMEIKYAAGVIEYKKFFNWNELRDSYRLYRKYKFSTVEMYLWDQIVTLISFVSGFIIAIIFPFFFFFLYPLYKLLFSHWPKSYGYGLLARKMYANDDLNKGYV